MRRICVQLLADTWPRANLVLTPALVLELVAACPLLEHTACAVRCLGFAAAVQAAAALPGLLQVDIRVPIGELSTAAELRRLLLLRSVSALDLCYLELTQADVFALAEALRVNNTLTSLSFELTDIGGDAGAIVLGEALGVNSALTSLDLADNAIGDAGVAALAEMLRVNSVLTSLNLDRNNIGDAGAIALGEALRVNSALAWLHVGGNLIGAAGVAALQEAARVKATLTLVT